MNLDTFLARQRWKAFRSLETSETIPPFAPVQLGKATDPTRGVIDDATGEYLLLAGQPYDLVSLASDGPEMYAMSVDDIAFNGPLEVLPGERGILTFDCPAIARFDGSVSGFLSPTTPAVGAAGWELQNVLPATGDLAVHSFFKALGIINIAGREYVTVLRQRWAASYQLDKIL